ncbi:hypothetical protein NN561_014742 [Cricetulus griseus]
MSPASVCAHVVAAPAAAVGGVRMRAQECSPSGGRSAPRGLFRWPRAAHTFPRARALCCDCDGRMLVRIVHGISPLLSVTPEVSLSSSREPGSRVTCLRSRREAPSHRTRGFWVWNRPSPFAYPSSLPRGCVTSVDVSKQLTQSLREMTPPPVTVTTAPRWDFPTRESHDGAGHVLSVVRAGGRRKRSCELLGFLLHPKPPK